MAILSNKDKQEFAAYLENCTDAQVRGVYLKEKTAKRGQYAALAAKEAWRRKIDLPLDD